MNGTELFLKPSINTFEIKCQKTNFNLQYHYFLNILIELRKKYPFSNYRYHHTLYIDYVFFLDSWSIRHLTRHTLNYLQKTHFVSFGALGGVSKWERHELKKTSW